MDEKDRFGEKIRDAERAREDTYFAQRDRELLEKLKKEQAQESDQVRRAALHMRCPKCGTALQERVQHGVRLDECEGCGGFWLDKGEFEQLAGREEEGWFGRLWRSRFGPPG